MKMGEIIQQVSEAYREENGKVRVLQEELDGVRKSLDKAERTHGENITYAQFNSLLTRENELTKDIKLKEEYCKGIYHVREMLMDLGFDTEIE